MKQTINRTQFHDAFKHMGRENSFSCAGLDALFDHFEQYEEDSGTELELDVIAICCDYTEIELSELETETGYSSATELAEHTTVIEVDEDIIIYGAF